MKAPVTIRSFGYPFLNRSISGLLFLLIFISFFISQKAKAYSYVITSTGLQSTGDGLITDISVCPIALGDTVFFATIIREIQTTDMTGGGLTSPKQARWKGIWRIRFGGIATTQAYGRIIFNFTDYGVGKPGTAFNYQMLHRPQGSLPNTPWTVTGSATISGDSVIFSAFNIPDDDMEYTLATLDTLLSPLPVTLTKFRAEINNGIVALSWTTASEINNSYFDVQRSANGMEWTNIGKVNGHGTTNSINTYTAIDNLADILPAAVLYYRLKQVDFNNTYQYSWIQQVNISKSTTAVQVYPNPAGNTLNIIWVNNHDENSELNLLNISGKIIFMEKVAGKGSLSKQINLTAYPAGTYFLQIVSNNSKTICQTVYKSQ